MRLVKGVKASDTDSCCLIEQTARQLLPTSHRNSCFTQKKTFNLKRICLYTCVYLSVIYNVKEHQIKSRNRSKNKEKQLKLQTVFILMPRLTNDQNESFYKLKVISMFQLKTSTTSNHVWFIKLSRRISEGEIFIIDKMNIRCSS